MVYKILHLNKSHNDRGHLKRVVLVIQELGDAPKLLFWEDQKWKLFFVNPTRGALKSYKLWLWCCFCYNGQFNKPLLLFSTPFFSIYLQILGSLIAVFYLNSWESISSLSLKYGIECIIILLCWNQWLQLMRKLCQPLCSLNFKNYTNDLITFNEYFRKYCSLAKTTSWWQRKKLWMTFTIKLNILWNNMRQLIQEKNQNIVTSKYSMVVSLM